jgi:hypothetical protein
MVSVIAEGQGAQDKFTAPHKHCKLRFMVLALPNISPYTPPIRVNVGG